MQIQGLEVNRKRERGDRKELNIGRNGAERDRGRGGGKAEEAEIEKESL